MASTQETSTNTIIKSDRMGRTRYSQAYKTEVVTAFEQSGMSAAAFAKHCGVKYPTLASWVAKAKTFTPSKTRGNDEARFIIAEFGSGSIDAPLKLELPSGMMVHVSSAHQFGLLAELLKTLS